MRELKVRTGTIITLHERERIETAAGVIEVVPAWRWVLGPISG